MEQMAQLLLEGGADPDLVDSDGSTPLMAAALHGRLGVLRLLLERGAALDTILGHHDYGWTAFHAACFKNQPDCVEALVLAGCDISVKCLDGRTGWQIAEAAGLALGDSVIMC
jgi:ankyrin repeat protein